MIADWPIKLGWLAFAYEKIQQSDVNPLLVVNGEPVAVEATIISQQPRLLENHKKGWLFKFCNIKIKNLPLLIFTKKASKYLRV